MPPKYTEQFRIDAVKQVVENGYGVLETADRLGIHQTSLSAWIKRYKSPQAMAYIKYIDPIRWFRTRTKPMRYRLKRYFKSKSK